ncbi:MAG TPA: sigma-70 family RNA polymerase sigma factor [Candidatus Hydrogenedentes bacterium]|nr:sigma-70 family RNA polymerase sigma factor [Candidatus Hydrogenedentota bacterium]
MAQKDAVSDADVIRKVRAGRREDFGILVQRYLPATQALAYSKTGNYADAEEIAQESFLRAFRYLDRLEEPAKFGAWIATIVKNTACTFLSRRRKRAEVAGGKHIERLAVSQDVESRDLRAFLRRQIGKLDEPHRDVLLLHYFAGMSAREIAGLLGISRNAVLKRLERARDVLGKHLVEVLGADLHPRDSKDKHISHIMGVVTTIPVTWKAVPLAAAPTLAAVAEKALGGAIKLASAKGAAALVCTAAVLGVGTALYARWPDSDRQDVSGQILAAAQQADADLPATDTLTEPGQADTAANSKHSEPGIQANLLAEQVTSSEGDAGGASFAPETFAAPPPRNPLDTEGVQLAARIIEEGWRTEPMPSCITGRALLAKLGDTTSCEWLLDMVKRIGDCGPGDNPGKANGYLFCILNDRRGVDFLAKLAAEPRAPFETRLDVVGYMKYSTEAVWGGSYPSAAVDVAATYCESGEQKRFKAMMIFLGRAATERARPLAEHLLLANAYDASGNPRAGSTLRGPRRFNPAEPRPPGEPSVCVAGWSLDILDTVDNPKSREVLHEYLATTDWESHKPQCAAMLWRMGDKGFALEYLKNGFQTADDISDILSYAYCLVRIGEKDHIRAIHSALDDPDQKVRVRAYGQLCRLGDDAFIAKAARDASQDLNPGPLADPAGYSQIRANDEWRLREKGLDPRPGDPPSGLFYRYLVALTHNTENPKLAAQGFGGLVLATEDQLQPVLPRCLDALEQTSVTHPEQGPQDPQALATWYLQIHKLNCLLVGTEDAEIQQRVVDKLRELYHRGGQFRGLIPRTLSWTGARGSAALPLVLEAMKKERRVIDAITYLAIEADEPIR